MLALAHHVQLVASDDHARNSSSNDELSDLTNRVVDRSMASGMEVSTEKNKVMANSTNDISTDISMNDQKTEELTSFKYMGATLCKDSTC